MQDHISQADVLSVLRLFPVPPTNTRKNILHNRDDFVQSITLGMSGPGVVTVSNATWECPTVFMLLNAWLMRSTWAGSFVWTSVQVNKGFACARHRDSGNAGPSLLHALGDFVGGNLLVWPEDKGFRPVNTLSERDALEVETRQWRWLDGRKAHETLPFSGERISVVFYAVSTWEQATDETLQVLRQLGAALPRRN